MRTYYRNKATGELKVYYNKIGNGVLLTEFDKDHGSPISNLHYQVFATEQELKNDWEPYAFKYAMDKTIQTNIVIAWKELYYQMTNHGHLENEKEGFDYIREEYDILDKLVKRDRTKDFTAWWESQSRYFRGDDEFEYGDYAFTVCAVLDSFFDILMKFNIQTKEK